MSIVHAYSQTVADGTATSVVRPSDWNSAHNMVLNIASNTAGTSQISGSDIIWAGGNNITLSASSNGVTVIGPNTVAQTVQTQASGNIVGAGFTTTTVAGAVVAATQNSAGLLMAVPNYLTTYANDLTSGRAGTGFSSTSTGGVLIVGTNNTAGLSLGVPNFITTYANDLTSGRAGAGYTSTTQGGTTVGATQNTAGLSMAWPPFITTYANDLTSGRAGTGTSLNLTNATATLAVNTNGVALSLSVAGGGVINQTGPNIAVAGQTVTAGTVYFSNSPTVTFGMDGASNITASAAGGGGGAATIGGYEIFPPLGGNTAFSTGGLGTIYFQKFIAPFNVSFNNFERRFSGSTASSSISAQAAHTISYGLYSLGSGASTSIYNLIASSSVFMQASYSSNLSAGLTVQQGATSFTASSAGTVGQSALTGYKHIYFPFTSTITAGGNYAFAMNMSSATTGATAPLRVGFLELSVINNLTIGKLRPSTIEATNASFVGDWAQGVYSSSSNGLPSTLAISGLTNAVSQQRMYLQLDA